MEFSKTQFFKLSPIGADEKALRAIAAELSKSGDCTFAYYQDRFPSLDALLAGRPLPLDRLELDAPAATVLIERHGVTVHHLPDADDDLEALREVLQRFTIPHLARCGLLCQLVLIGLVLVAWVKSDFSFMVLVFVVSMLLEHVLSTLAIPDPVVRLPWGMSSDHRVQTGLGIAIVVLFVAAEAFRTLSN